MPSPTCTVNGLSTAAAVVLSAGATLQTIALADSTGVTTWSLTCTSTDETTTVAAVNAALVVNSVSKTATFSAPAPDSAAIFTSIINGGLDSNGAAKASYTTSFKVYTGTQVLASNEKTESSASNGWTAVANPAIRSSLRTTSQTSVVRLLCVGDSLTAGPANTGYEDSPGGIREPLDLLLQQRRRDVRLIGSLISIPVPARSSGPTVLSRMCTEGHSGNTIVQLTTGVPTWVATSGVADAWLDVSGTNDANNGDDAATMLANKALLFKALQTAHPGAVGFCSSIPSFSAPAASAAAKAAVVATFNAGLPALCTQYGITFVDGFPLAGGGGAIGSYTDGIHRTSAASAYAAAAFLDAFELKFPIRRGPAVGRFQRPREQISLAGTATDTSVSTAATDGIRFTTAAERNPGAGSWAAGVWVLPTVPAPALRSIITLGTALQVGVLINAQAIKLYVNGSNVQSFSMPGSVLDARRAHRIIVARDIVSAAYLVFVDGILRGTDSTAYAPPDGLAWYIGAEPQLFSGWLGAYKGFFLASGASMPTMHTAVNGRTLEEAVEADYYDQIPIGGMSFASELNDGVSNGITPDRGFPASPVGLRENVQTAALGGGWSWVATRWPWLRSFAPGEDLRGTFVLNGATGVTVTCPGMIAGDEDGIAMVRTVNGGTPNIAPLVVAGTDLFTVTGIAADTSTYSWRWRPQRLR